MPSPATVTRRWRDRGVDLSSVREDSVVPPTTVDSVDVSAAAIVDVNNC